MPKPALEVIKPGLLTTVQDRGRFLFQWMGMSTSGALDSFSYRIGNLLVGNSEDDAGLEMTMAGPTLRVLQDSWIAVTGAKMSVTKDGTPLPLWTRVKVRQGDILSCGYAKEGCRGYLSVRGGLSVPVVMGSRSTNLRLKIGGKEGRPVTQGDILAAHQSPNIAGFKERALPTEFIPCLSPDVTLRVIMGPQSRYFQKDIGIRTFLHSQYVVTPQTDRMGYRLDGPAIKHRQDVKKSIPSEACCPGGVQVPEDGKPIILLVEQNGGGYIKIATIISPDVDRVAQLKPGDKIRFERISLTKAHKILRNREKSIQNLKESWEIR